MRSMVLAGLLVVGLAACRSPAPGAAVVAPPAPTAARAGLPDRACTPGAVDPRVTAETIHRTICARGYTRTVRPAREVTDAIKRRQIRAYGDYAGSDPRAYELDHLVSLELGGAPADEANLWPQARGGVAGAEQKDAVENWLHQEVCAGRLPLAEAQRQIATDWRAAYAALPEAAKSQVGEGAGEGP
jgi:hypothetical protein